jgi:cation/acetate symporter
VGLAFAIAASANFPALLLSITWKKFSTRGAVWSIIAGAVSASLCILFSPVIWVNILGFEKAIFPLKNPAIVSMSIAFLAAYIGSVTAPEPESQEKFEQEKIRTYLGVGAE